MLIKKNKIPGIACRVAASSNNGIHWKTSSAVFHITLVGYPSPQLRISWSVISLVSSDTGRYVQYKLS